MQMAPAVKARIVRNAIASLGIYTLPVALMFAALALTQAHPWEHLAIPHTPTHPLGPGSFFKLDRYGLVLFTLALGVVEFLLGLYDEHWRGNERTLDIVCFILPKIVVAPITAYFSLRLLPLVCPNLHGVFAWVSFGWACLIIAIADYLTQYWYHRLHHEIPWLWRFHRTHHSASYMGMVMASRQNILYTLFFSQTYLTAILVFAGLGPAAVAVRSVKSVITLTAHSSIPWDRVLERLISTPATHHAHHAATSDDGIGHYKGNFGNMFFIWDVIFDTAHISRQYPEYDGISHYRGDPWYSQIFWPIFKSNVPGSELAPGGPEVHPDVSIPGRKRAMPIAPERYLDGIQAGLHEGCGTRQS